MLTLTLAPPPSFLLPFFQVMLTRDKHDCTFINDVMKAENALDEQSFDLVITAGEAGVDLCRFIRFHEQSGRKMPAVIAVLKTEMGDEERQSFVEAGVQNVLVKPIGKQDIKDMIQSIFAKRKSSRSPSIDSGTLPASARSSGSFSVVDGSLSGGTSTSTNPHQSGALRRSALVVDDDVGQRMLLKSMLERENFTCDTVIDGEAAVQVFFLFLCAMPSCDFYDLHLCALRGECVGQRMPLQKYALG